MEIDLRTAVMVACGFLPLLFIFSGNNKRSVATKNKRKEKGADEASTVSTNMLTVKPLDTRRRTAIAYGKATDHFGDVIILTNSNFDLNSTIFVTAEGALTRLFLKTKLGNEIYWSEEALSLCNARSIPLAPIHNQDLMDFMLNDCNFKMEHADGSFLDHLQFCYEYSNAHYKAHSPRVLFLHSIMGVGTNFFPMEKDKIPKLKSLLSDFEFKHIEAFPSILRMLVVRDLINDLMQFDSTKLATLSKISFHRVIDNAEISLNGEDFWIHLNYQLIHLLDFLPVSNWLVQLEDPTFQAFISLYNFLQHSKKLTATLDFDLSSGEKTSTGIPLTLGSFLNSLVPSSVKRKLGTDLIRNYSKRIGHSLGYRIQW